jgi:hypothetical protein
VVSGVSRSCSDHLSCVPNSKVAASIAQPHRGKLERSIMSEERSSPPSLSRRGFLAAAGLGAAAAIFAPRLLFTQETGIVPTMINEAARAKIEVRRQRDWPADDAWLRPGLEIAFAIPTSTDQRLLRICDLLPGLLANCEMTQRSNPAFSKPVNRKSLPRLPN